MSLAARRSSRQREDFVMRLGCVLVSVAVLASLVLEPPRARAIVATSSAISALAGGFLAAWGMTPVVSGVEGSEGVARSIDRMVREYVDTIGAPTPEEWLGQNLALTVSGGKIYLPKPIAAKLGQFAAWVASKYGTNTDGAVKPGVNVVFCNQSVTFADGSVYNFLVLGEKYSSSVYYVSQLGTPIPFGTEADPTEIQLIPGRSVLFSLIPREDGSGFSSYGIYRSWNPGWITNQSSTETSGFSCFCIRDGSLYICFVRHNLLTVYVSLQMLSSAQLSQLSVSNSSLSLDVAENMEQILDRLTALEEGQSVALDVGATQTMGIQEILQDILAAILAGNLAATAEVVDTAEEPVDPEEPNPPVVPPELPSGLDRLGAALTSRFPFSIPWDMYKGVSLLAVPAKAPYFEVDFLEPIAYRVGGWQGSTKIVLDMSEYEIIGQVCRWTSTIGFCLMLASGTKRLIWTA